MRRPKRINILPNESLSFSLSVGGELGLLGPNNSQSFSRSFSFARSISACFFRKYSSSLSARGRASSSFVMTIVA